MGEILKRQMMPELESEMEAQQDSVDMAVIWCHFDLSDAQPFSLCCVTVTMYQRPGNFKVLKLIWLVMVWCPERSLLCYNMAERQRELCAHVDPFVGNLAS